MAAKRRWLKAYERADAVKSKALYTDGVGGFGTGCSEGSGGGLPVLSMREDAEDLWDDWGRLVSY